MKLPHAEHAIIEPVKLLDYCLSADHDEGKHKALLFDKLLGIKPDNVDKLVDQLRRAIQESDAVPGKQDEYG